MALDAAAPLERLLAALGATAQDEPRSAPFEVQACVFELADGGCLVIVPGRHQVAGHPLVAVVMATRIGATRWLPPGRTHGLWLGLQP